MIVLLNQMANNPDIAHEWVNHQINFVDHLDPNVRSQGIEATWSAVKAKIRRLQGTSPALMPSYLDQYIFRRAHKNERLRPDYTCLLCLSKTRKDI